MNDIEGQWLDRRTGKTVFVRDMIQDGENMVIVSSIGTIPPEVFSNYFVRMSDEDYGNTGVMPEMSGDAMIAAINNGLSEEEKITAAPTILDIPITKKSNDNSDNVTIENKPVNNISKQKQNTNTQLIKKVFDKMNTEPQITFSVNLDEWPIKELNMLINVLDIPFDDISDYVITNYLSKEILISCFSEYLQKALENDK